MEKAVVTSVISLTQKEKEVISNRMERIVGYKIALQFIVDKLILGGLQVTIGYWKFDGSLLVQLKSITRQLVQ